MIEYYKHNQLSSVIDGLDTVLKYPYWEHIANTHITEFQPPKVSVVNLLYVYIHVRRFIHIYIYTYVYMLYYRYHGIRNIYQKIYKLIEKML